MKRTAFHISLLLLALLSGGYSAYLFSHAATSNSVLFDREIVRILNIHCVMCHMDGGPAASLASYEETWLSREAIHDQILARHMPPWAAVSGYGNFANANHLTLREKRFIVSWVEGLGPRNNGEVFFNVGVNEAGREPMAARFDPGAWRLGNPDRDIRVEPADYGTGSLPNGSLTRAQVAIDPALTEDSFLSGIEFLPDDRRHLHAVVFTLAGSGQWLATWTPWYGYRQLPAGTGVILNAGDRIIADYYFAINDSGIVPGVTGILGLHFAEADNTKPVTTLIQEFSGRIPAGAAGHRLQAEMTLDTGWDVSALWPELPAGTQSLEVSARHPDGRVEILLLALDIPADWATAYLLETPVTLPADTRLTVTAYVGNPRDRVVERSGRLTLSVF